MLGVGLVDFLLVNNLTVETSTDYKAIETWIKSTGIVDYVDRQLITLKEGYKLDTKARYVIIKEEQKILAIAKYSYMTEVAIDYHLYVDPILWGKNKVSEIDQAIMTWYLNNTRITAVSIFSPAACTHVHSASLKCGYECSGIIKFGIIWDQKLQDLYIFNKTLWRI